MKFAVITPALIAGTVAERMRFAAFPLAMGGGGRDYLVTETTTTAVLVICAWLIGWTSPGHRLVRG